MSMGLALLSTAEQFGDEVDCSGNERGSSWLRAAAFVDEHSSSTLSMFSYKTYIFEPIRLFRITNTLEFLIENSIESIRP